MNRKSTSILRNPILNEFLYTVLYNANYEDKRKLQGKYLRAAISEKTAKSFVAHSTRDEKEYVLATLGFEFFYVIAKKDTKFKQFKDLLSKFENKKQVQAMAEIAQMGVFVTSDREITRLLGLMSKAIHHPTFFLNMELLNQGYNIRKWKRRAANHLDEDVREADEVSRSLSMTMLHSHIALQYCRGSVGLGESAMMILLYLHYHKMGNIPHTSLFAYFDGNMTKTEFTYAMKALNGGYCIETNSDNEHSITGEGIKKVNLLLDYILKWNNL